MSREEQALNITIENVGILRERLAAKDAEIERLKAERNACWAEFKVMTRTCLEAEKERDELRARVVVVPEQRKPRTLFAVEEACDTGWNYCLDELARLNGKTVSEGLLRDAIKWLDVHAQPFSAEQYVADELRALLGEGKEVKP